MNISKSKLLDFLIGILGFITCYFLNVNGQNADYIIMVFIVLNNLKGE